QAREIEELSRPGDRVCFAMKRGPRARVATMEERRSFDHTDRDALGQHRAVPAPIFRGAARTGMALREGELQRDLTGHEEAGGPMAEFDQLFGPEVWSVRGEVPPDNVFALKDHGEVGA